MRSFHSDVPIQNGADSDSFDARRLRAQVLHVLGEEAHLLKRLDGLRAPAPAHKRDGALDEQQRVVPDALRGLARRFCQALGRRTACPRRAARLRLDPAAEPELEHPAARDEARAPDAAAAVDEDRDAAERVRFDEAREVRVERRRVGGREAFRRRYPARGVSAPQGVDARATYRRTSRPSSSAARAYSAHGAPRYCSSSSSRQLRVHLRLACVRAHRAHAGHTTPHNRRQAP